MNKSPISLVAHTHWDREWYEPFQRFRMRLVDVVDDVLIRAAADPRFHFTFDGQLAAVQDYLEIRPEQRDRLAALVKTGQFAVGPWRVLLDEFLCSGENIIRNLQIGRRQSAALGPMMQVGYLPDMFGHIAQMPQLLRLAGLEHACVYRGVPKAVTTHAFRWSAPDGSMIRTEYLFAGYGNMSDLFDDPSDLAGRLQRRLDKLRPWFGDDDMLAMYGTDHSGPLPTLMEQVARLDTAEAEGLNVTTLDGYVTSFDPAGVGLPELAGELRSHARSNILPGVISIRPALKKALAQAERMLERYAEPLAALYRPADQWPSTQMDMAWLRLVDSSCHDSVTGCGVDDTAVQVGARIAEGEQIGQAIRDAVLTELAADVPSSGALIVNPSPWDRVVQVELDLPADEADGSVALALGSGEVVATQQVRANDRILSDELVDASELATLFRRVHDRELFGREISRMVIDTKTQPPELRFEVAAEPGPAPWDHLAARAEAAAAAATRPGSWRARIIDEPRLVVVADVLVPALGLTSARLTADPAPAIPNGVTASPAGLTSDSMSVTVNDDGTLQIRCGETTLDGVGRIVDSGDTGDSYNYGPPANDVVVSEPDDVEISVLESGPLRARLLVRRIYWWPVSSDLAGRADALASVRVDMTVELRRGEQFVRLGIEFDNQVRDHRVRLEVPCARPSTSSDAEGQFAVVRRSGDPETGPVGEFGIPTYPASGFVDAGGAGVLLNAVTEYELLAGPDRLAITLVRGVGYLSRNIHPYRDEPAGPNLPTPLGQSLGPVHTRLAVSPHHGDWAEADLSQSAEGFRLDPVTRIGGCRYDAPLPKSRAGLEVKGPGVRLSAVQPGPGDSIDIRLYAETNEAATASIDCRGRSVTSAALIDFHGATIASVPVANNVAHILLQPWQIATVRMTSS